MIRAFVSSTYEDLKAHRAYVIDRLEHAGIWVDPMEKWSAASDEPKELSQDRVRECDICILLVGFRLGHVPVGERLSITQLEYEEALRRELDVLVFLADEKADWPEMALEELQHDPRIRKWRDNLREHLVTGFFNAHPASIDIGSALLRLFADWASKDKSPKSATVGEEANRVKIRVYSSSGAALIVWSAEAPIPKCLGFAVHRRTLGIASVTEEVLDTRMGFRAIADGKAGERRSSAAWPVQRFRWVDRLDDNQEARYRVVPVIGRPGDLKESDDVGAGSAWTSWISRRTAHTPGVRAFFNNNVGRGGPFLAELQKQAKKFSVKDSSSAVFFGGELRRMLVATLTGAKQLNQRVFIILAGLDDGEVIHALESLGKKLYLVRGHHGRRPKARGEEQVCRTLDKSSAHIYPEQSRGPFESASNVAVFCDDMGSPKQVWLGSGAWTNEAFCIQENSGMLIDSVSLSRELLDRWEQLRDAASARRALKPASRPAQIGLGNGSITLWNAPTSEEQELRDALRLVRGARQGVLFSLHNGGEPSGLLKEILQLGGGDLFIQGLSVSETDGSVTLHQPPDATLITRGLCGKNSLAVINSTVVLVDPFGPHPVLITGSHDLRSRTSSQREANLLIFENTPGLAAEYAVHVIRLFDHYKFRSVALPANAWRGLMSDDAWQQPYFRHSKRTEFNFLFGTLSPGL